MPPESSRKLFAHFCTPLDVLVFCGRFLELGDLLVSRSFCSAPTGNRLHKKRAAHLFLLFLFFRVLAVRNDKVYPFSRAGLPAESR